MKTSSQQGRSELGALKGPSTRSARALRPPGPSEAGLSDRIPQSTNLALSEVRVKGDPITTQADSQRKHSGKLVHLFENRYGTKYSRLPYDQ